jgi:hypothetical protein
VFHKVPAEMRWGSPRFLRRFYVLNKTTTA